MQRLDVAEQRLHRALRQHIEQARLRLSTLTRRLHLASPQRQLTAQQSAHDARARRLGQAMRRRLEQADRRLANAGRGLHAVSPLQTLERGYAIARDDHNHVVRSADTVNAGDSIQVVLARGRLDCEVREIHTDSGAGIT